MIYYGFNIINASVFLPTCVIISAIVAIATGSSWSTTATIGIALIGIGKVLGFDLGLVAGAVISGAYFGDKMSPLSDTTNLAAAVTESIFLSILKYDDNNNSNNKYYYNFFYNIQSISIFQ